MEFEGDERRGLLGFIHRLCIVLLSGGRLPLRLGLHVLCVVVDRGLVLQIVSLHRGGGSRSGG